MCLATRYAQINSGGALRAQFQRQKLPGSCQGCAPGVRWVIWVIVSSSDEMLQMLDVLSIVLSSVRHSGMSSGTLRTDPCSDLVPRMDHQQLVPVTHSQSLEMAFNK